MLEPDTIVSYIDDILLQRERRVRRAVAGARARDKRTAGAKSRPYEKCNPHALISSEEDLHSAMFHSAYLFKFTTPDATASVDTTRRVGNEK